jgi:hypothetical protein
MKIIVKGEVKEVADPHSSMELTGVVISPEALDKLKKVDHEALFISWGVRCYYGAYDSKTQAVFDYQEKAFKLVKEVVENITITYFPMEGKFMAGQRFLACSAWHSTRGGVVSELVNQLLAHAEKDPTK